MRRKRTISSSILRFEVLTIICMTESLGPKAVELTTSDEYANASYVFFKPCAEKSVTRLAKCQHSKGTRSGTLTKLNDFK